jgi:thymidylate kinase
MKNLVTIFKKLNLNFINEFTDEIEANTKLHYINNPNGSIRWIWPSQLEKPIFLKFYSISTLRSWTFAFVIRMIFLFRLQRFVFRKLDASFHRTKIKPLIEYHKNNWALFTGTAGPNRKVIVYRKTQKGSSFLKVGLNAKSKSLINKEIEVLRDLKDHHYKCFVFPKIFQSGMDFVEVSDISFGAKRNKSLTTTHINTLTEMNEKTSQLIRVKHLPIWEQLKSDLETLKLTKNSRIPNGLLKKISFLIATINDSAMIETCCCHGDFTPWNMYVKNNNLHIYDWELYKEQMPFGFDALHFIIQKGILIDRKPWIEIEKEINETFDQISFGVLSNGDSTDKKLYLRLYLITNIIFSLKIFLEQEDWHEQIYWSLNTWNEAISSTITNLVKHRSLLLMDLFDFVLNKPYAAIKFPNTNPEQIDDLTDVDLCVDKKTSTEINNYFKKHPLVLSCKVVNKSYMKVMNIICKDGSNLFVDLIFELRRKSFVLMKVQSLIQKATLNEFQVKIPKDQDLGRFIGLFYISNSASIPLKYLKFTNSLKTSNNPLDQNIYKITNDIHLNRASLISILKDKPTYNSLNRLKYILLFLIDTAKDILKRPGLIITFSGVDGAGKSTLISKVKYNLEKKLRKRVVVIRHRPSLFPILSAWTKGKKVAESEASSQLPRQGNNSSILSSILRFSYYYLDYLIGQFVVSIKYKLRGFVVLYDRYYFDFINDSKRSNIVLPSYLTRFGYSFLLKPNINFFLYANPKIIRSRKKELDSQTISYLTKKYKILFKELNEKDSKNQYISIENSDLSKTLNSVVDRIQNSINYTI